MLNPWQLGAPVLRNKLETLACSRAKSMPQ
jgi:hypothetical protein